MDKAARKELKERLNDMQLAVTTWSKGYLDNYPVSDLKVAYGELGDGALEEFTRFCIRLSCMSRMPREEYKAFFE